MRAFLFAIQLLVPALLPAVIVLNPAPPDCVAIDWDGIDDLDGDGTAAFSSLGETISATLRILCNATNGYRLFLEAANVKSQSSSYLKQGTDRILYTGSMDTSGIQNANIRTQKLRLKGNKVTLRVKFNRAGNVLPMDGNTQANVLLLYFTLASFTGELYPVGTYTDTITATITLP